VDDGGPFGVAARPALSLDADVDLDANRHDFNHAKEEDNQSSRMHPHILPVLKHIKQDRVIDRDDNDHKHEKACPEVQLVASFTAASTPTMMDIFPHETPART
jgi:hypothetical protein